MAWPMLARNVNGMILVATKKIIGNTINPWTNRPMITVKKYNPSCPIITAKLSASIILAATKKKTPIGDNLA